MGAMHTTVGVLCPRDLKRLAYTTASGATRILFLLPARQYVLLVVLTQKNDKGGGLRVMGTRLDVLQRVFAYPRSYGTVNIEKILLVVKCLLTFSGQP